MTATPISILLCIMSKGSSIKGTMENQQEMDVDGSRQAAVAHATHAPHEQSSPSTATGANGENGDGKDTPANDELKESVVDTESMDVSEPPAARESEGDGVGEGKPPPSREHNLEQELVDYEVEEGDLMPIDKQGPEKPSVQTGDKPQPPKISWNEWAGADATDIAKRTAESKKAEKKRDGAPVDVRRDASDTRKTRENVRDGRGPSGRYPRHEPGKYRRDNRRSEKEQARDRSPTHRAYGNSNPGSTDAALRREPVTTIHAGMPPGMNYNRGPSSPRFAHSGPTETSRASVRPYVKPVSRPMPSRAMPPGLGVPGTEASNMQQSSYYSGASGGRRPLSARNDETHRGRSSPLRSTRPSKPASLPRRGVRYRRSHSPQPIQDEAHRPINRPRSPPHDGPLSQTDHPPSFQRPLPRSRDQFPQEGNASLNSYRQRTEQPTARPRPAAPASPRRFVLPDKRVVVQRQKYQRPPGAEQDRIPFGDTARMAESGRLSPSRGYQRRPSSLPLKRSGALRDSPPPMHLPVRRHQRHPPSIRQRRDPDIPLLRKNERMRPDFVNTGPERQLYGSRMELDNPHRGDVHAGRYGDQRREPPASPGREIKRQRQSPNAGQRFRHDPVRYRGVVKSPHENPPNADGLTGIPIHYPENECTWYYVDPQGNTQGPCTIAQFRSWLRTLADDPQFADEHKQFMSVDVWKEGSQKKQLMTTLLDRNAM